LEIGTILPDIPSPYEYMVIFSDVRSSLQCTTCPPTRLLSNLSFQDALLRLYGSGSSNQIYLNRISSYTFQQLNEILNEVTEPSEPFLLDNLKRASWVVFNVLDINGEFPASTALKRILAEREDLLRDKHVVVFAMDTPFYLDATEISKVSAYYGLFSRTPEFVEVAARVLMQEIEPTGALPLSVSSVAYDLLKATSPDPDQIIQVNLVPNTEAGTLTPTPEVTEGEDPVPMFSIGESIQIAAGTILDHNHNPVPDGTVVRFTISVVEENVILEQQDATTTDGMARITYRIDRGGTLEVTAISEPAIISSKLLLNIERGIAEVIMPTPTLAPTLTPTLSPTITPQVTPTAEAAIEPVTKNMPVFSDWILTMLLVLAGVGITYMIGYFWWGTRLWGLRSAMCAALGGSLAYVLLSLGFPGLKAWVERAGTSFILQTVFIGLLLGWIAALIWWMIVEGSKPQIKRT
jgi:beta-N-acetylhexosaminidase